MTTPLHILITAGPSQEPIDAVRFIGNRSSGRMGVAIAAAALEAGHRVTLLLGPVAVTPPPGATIIPFRTAADLEALLREHAPQADLLIMAAAVADYRPVAADAEDLRQRKIERAAELTLRLEPVPDLLAAVAASARPEQRIIGFALEEAARLEERARAKLLRKRVHAVVANPLATMDAMGVEGQLLLADGTVRRPPGWPKPIGKDEFARWLVREARGLWT
jgi:phosphopantothenoylcysteine decarboxylase/phosphopantothenate--cysteine ligase